MKNILLLAVWFFSFTAFASPGDLIQIEHLSDDNGEYTLEARKKFCPDTSHLTTVFGFKRYKVDFKTNDLKGNEVTSSGLLIIPNNEGAKPMFVYQHGTVFARSELPSSAPMFTEADAAAYCYSSLGYISVLADYLGYGDGTGVHPYLHADSEAWVGRDMMRASRTAIKNLNAQLNDQIFIAGYSQGGHAAMALLRLLESDPAQEFKITAAAPMAGPYALAETIGEVIETPTRNSAPEAAFLLLGLNPVYGLYTKLDEVVRPEYVARLENLFDGKSDWGVVRAQLSMTPKQLIRADYIENLQKDTQAPFLQALRANEVYQWVPKTPINFMHGKADHEVPYSNSEKAHDYMKERGANVQLTNLGEVSHMLGAPLAFGQGVLWFETFR